MPAFRAAIEGRIAAKTAAVLELLGQRDWDVFFVTYHDSHDVGHIAWHLHEQSENLATADVSNARIQDPLKACYQLLDQSIATLQTALVPGGDTLVVMGPGMERNVSGNHLLPDVLRAFQKKPRTWLTTLAAQSARALIHSSVVPSRFQKQIKSVKSRAGVKFQGISGRPYFSLPHNTNAGAVRINVVGRDPHGVVAPGRAYDDLYADLTERLLRLRDASGKVSLVKEVVKVHRHYDGPELNTLPDLMVIWNRKADMSGVSSPDVGAWRALSASHRTGDHTVRGMIIGGDSLPSVNLGPLNPAQVTPLLVFAARRVSQAMAR